MDDSYMNQRHCCSRCSHMMPPPPVSSGCGCDMPSTMVPPMPSCSPTMPMPSSPPAMPTLSSPPAMPCMRGRQHYCPDTSPGCMEQYPVGMGYVPWQQWQQTYPMNRAFERGTIFPDLDLPFVMGRCR